MPGQLPPHTGKNRTAFWLSDSELQEAYSGATGMNSAMSGEFPILKPGMNAISWSGNVTRVEVKPNWRYLV